MNKIIILISTLLFSIGILAADQNVTLKRVSLSGQGTQIPYTIKYVLQGEVEVKNISYQKQVTIYYNAGGDNWKTKLAKYAGISAKGGYEIWSFQIEENAYKNPSSDFLNFAIRYDIVGATFWDNNYGHNYPRPTNVTWIY